MGLPWVRLDTTFHHNPKVLDLAARGKYRAAFAYVCSLAYAGQHGTDGYLPEACLVFIHATWPSPPPTPECATSPRRATPTPSSWR